MTFTAQQVEEAIVAEHTNYVWTDLRYGVGLVDLEIEGELVNLEYVDGSGGMDEGSHASVVFKIGDQYFVKEGHYMSHYGFEWDAPLYEATPAEKTVTHYERND